MPDIRSFRFNNIFYIQKELLRDNLSPLMGKIFMSYYEKNIIATEEFTNYIKNSSTLMQYVDDIPINNMVKYAIIPKDTYHPIQYKKGN